MAKGRGHVWQGGVCIVKGGLHSGGMHGGGMCGKWRGHGHAWRWQRGM